MAAKAQRFWTRRLLAGIFGVADEVLREGSASEAAVARLGETLGEMTALGDLAGRLRMILDARRARQGQPAMTEQGTAIPAIPFAQALTDLRSRVPELARAAEEVAEVYRRHGFALARSSSVEVTARVQRMLADARERGEPRPTTIDAIAEMGDWSRGYAETVYRTNIATASTEGRFQQARSTRGLIPAFEYLTMADADVRGRVALGQENHWALHGFVAAVDSPTWQAWAPPGGYNCRCSLRPMTRDDVARRGLLSADGSVIERPVPMAARFADGFGGRVQIYGSGS